VILPGFRLDEQNPKTADLVPYTMPYNEGMRKTSVYLNEEQTERLARLAREEGRSQAEILREAVATYQPKPSRDRNFALAAGFRRIDGDPRSISEIPEEELLEGFGE
jgi:predicted DNA-binding protein